MTPRDSIPHETRTAAEPRQNKLCPVRLAHIEQINPTIRLLRLALPAESLSEDEEEEPFSFLPGQWLDVYVPGIQQAGGFTITSTPSDARPLPKPDLAATEMQIQDDGAVGGTGTAPPSKVHISAQHPDADFAVSAPGTGSFSNGRYPYVELAVQSSPSNPPAAWLWRPTREILGCKVNVRVGGSFVWPPATLPISQICKVVLVAGGVGINPLISILAHITELASNPGTTTATTATTTTTSTKHLPAIHFLYTTRIPHAEKLLLDSKLATPQNSINRESLDEILFLSRLRRIVHRMASCLDIRLDVFLTNIPSAAPPSVVAQAARSLREEGSRDADPGAATEPAADQVPIHVHGRRINKQDLDQAVGKDNNLDKDGIVCYVCGPPPMTDEFVDHLSSVLGPDRVLCEKWW